MLLDKFKNNIVKIQSKDADGSITNFGTGIALSKTLIFTVEHVLIDENIVVVTNDDKTYSVKLMENNYENTVVRLLVSDNPMEAIIHNIFLTPDYCCNLEDQWNVFGYLGQIQIDTFISGKGLIDSSNGFTILQDIHRGEVKNYRGVSGSPVFVDGMIVGIVNEQLINSSEAVAIRMLKASEFIQYIPDEHINENIYKININRGLTEITENEIDKNITSKKYIPEIFVEEHDYKEMMRFFSEPLLFIRKAIRDISKIDLTDINKFLIKYQLPQLDILDSKELFDELTIENYLDIAQNLINQLQKAIELMDESRKVETNIDESKLNEFLNDRSSFRNNSIKFILDDIKRNLEFVMYRAVLLTKDAGQGKTNFLCDFTNNFLLKKQYNCLYLNAYDFRETPVMHIEKILCDISGLDLEKTYRYLRHNYLETGRPFVIVIDGLNENTQLENIAQYINSLISHFMKFDFIKIIMTTRNELFEEKFNQLKDFGPGFHKIEMFRRDSEKFNNRIFDGYLKHFNITIRDYTLFDSVYKRLTNDTLLLRFFCEANKGQKSVYMYDIYTFRIFEEYSTQKISELNILHKDIVDCSQIYQNVLDKIIVHMINNKEFRQVPIEIFTPEEQKLLMQLLINDMIFKDEEMVTQGLLSSKVMVISFTFDEFRDYCITKYIAKLWSADKISRFLHENIESTIYEGVSKYLFFVAKLPTGTELLDYLKGLNYYKKIYWNNIFKIEDQYINEEDIENIVNSFESHSDALRKRIVSDLMFKFDCSYYKNLNIKNLYSIMDKMNKDIFYEIFKPMFQRYYKKHEYDYYQNQNTILLPVNVLMDNLKHIISQGNCYDLFKISFYIYEFGSFEVEEFWIEYLKESSENAVKTLSEMNNHNNEFVNQNVKKLLLSLIMITDICDEKVFESLNRLNVENRCPSPDASSTNILKQILGDLYEDL